MAPKRKRMTWSATQEEFKPQGRNKLVKRSEKTPIRKLLGQHKWVAAPANTSEPTLQGDRVRFPSHQLAATNVKTKNGKSSIRALPRKIGRNKLVFATKPKPPPPVDRTIRTSPRLDVGRNKLILTKTIANESWLQEETTSATSSIKHLRANYKATKSGLKRVEPAICKFFQHQGMCFDTNCPYRHVKVGRHAK